MYTIGLDYHQWTSSMHILDAKGNTVKRQTILGDWRDVIQWLKQVEKPFRIVYEASCGYGHLYDRLRRIASQVIVAHPGQLRLIFRAKRKNDRIDAQKLAVLGHLNQVPPVHVPRQEVRAWRELIEFRRKSVEKRARVKNQIRTLLRSYGVIKPREVRGYWTKAGRAWIAALTWPSEVTQLRCQILLEELAAAEARVGQITKVLDQRAQSHPGVALLRTVPGIGPRTAEALMAYIDDPYRFVSSRGIGSYFGMVPAQDSSAGVNRLGHITKQGPSTVRKLITEATWQSIGRDEHLRAYFDRICNGKRERRKIALIATAHYLLRVMLAMLKSGEVWQPRKAAAWPRPRRRRRGKEKKVKPTPGAVAGDVA